LCALDLREPAAGPLEPAKATSLFKTRSRNLGEPVNNRPFTLLRREVSTSGPFGFNDRGVMAGLVVAALVVTGPARSQEVPTVTVPSKTIYGERTARAPRELDVFAFLIGTWEGRGKTRLPDGKVAEYPVAWIGRYILDGTAIADEAHAPYPDGRPSLGITFRQYDQSGRRGSSSF